MNLLIRSNPHLRNRGYRFLRAQFVPGIDSIASFCSSSPAQSDPLHRRIVRAGDPSTSMIPILDQWREEGNVVTVPDLQRFIRMLRNYKRYKHALQVAEWMSIQKGYRSSDADVAVRLDLISKVHGFQKGEEYFNSIPESSQGYKVYGALLNSYVYARQLEKAEDLMQKIRKLGFVESELPYEAMLTLYSQMGKYEKLDLLLQEVEEKGMKSSKYAFGTRLQAYVASSDIEGMEKFLIKMEADPIIKMDFRSYIVAANGYLKAGYKDKALSMLKRAEAFISTNSKNLSYEILISMYASIGNKDEVFRVWKLYKKIRKVFNTSYLCMMTSLLKLNDLESAETIWDEWNKLKSIFDIRIPNTMILAYTRKGLLDKAEACLDKIIESGKQPDATSWDFMASGYQASGQMEKAIGTIKKAIAVSKPGWKPALKTITACLFYLRNRDIEAAKELLEMIDRDCRFSKGASKRLSRIIEDKADADHTLQDSKQMEGVA